MIQAEISGAIPVTVNVKVPVPNVPYSGNFIGFTQVPVTIYMPAKFEFPYPASTSPETMFKQTLETFGKWLFDVNSNLVEYAYIKQQGIKQQGIETTPTQTEEF